MKPADLARDDIHPAVECCHSRRSGMLSASAGCTFPSQFNGTQDLIGQSPPANDVVSDVVGLGLTPLAKGGRLRAAGVKGIWESAVVLLRPVVEFVRIQNVGCVQSELSRVQLLQNSSERPGVLSKLRVGVVATVARAWERLECRLITHGLATVATPKSRFDKAPSAPFYVSVERHGPVMGGSRPPLPPIPALAPGVLYFPQRNGFPPTKGAG